MKSLPLFDHFLCAGLDRLGLSSQEDSVCVRVRSGGGGRFRHRDKQEPLLCLFEGCLLGLGTCCAYVHYGGIVAFTAPSRRETLVPVTVANLVSPCCSF